MRVLVCGGRDFSDRKMMREVLSRIHAERPFTCLIHGGAAGADRLAEDWGRDEGLPVIRVDANWDRYGRSAGPIRNGWMLDLCQPDAVVAFPGGSGTADMVARARAAAVEVLEISKR